jgi:hypothetical protein
MHLRRLEFPSYLTVARTGTSEYLSTPEELNPEQGGRQVAEVLIRPILLARSLVATVRG